MLNPGNPGGGKEEDHLFRLLGDLAETKEERAAKQIFDVLMEQTKRCMTGTGQDDRGPWKVYSGFVKKILDGANLSLDHVAYMNVCHFPTKKNSSGLADQMVHASLVRHSEPLMKALDPKCVIFRYQKSRNPWPSEYLPRYTYIVGGIGASNADIQRATQIVRDALAGSV